VSRVWQGGGERRARAPRRGPCGFTMDQSAVATAADAPLPCQTFGERGRFFPYAALSTPYWVPTQLRRVRPCLRVEKFLLPVAAHAERLADGSQHWGQGPPRSCTCLHMRTNLGRAAFETSPYWGAFNGHAAWSQAMDPFEPGLAGHIWLHWQLPAEGRSL